VHVALSAGIDALELDWVTAQVHAHCEIDRGYATLKPAPNVVPPDAAKQGIPCFRARSARNGTCFMASDPTVLLRSGVVAAGDRTELGVGFMLPGALPSAFKGMVSRIWWVHRPLTPAPTTHIPVVLPR
jgi:hypothetical protein